MFPPQSKRSKEVCRRVAEFMEQYVYSNEGLYKRQRRGDAFACVTYVT
jgi:hypothetical protein